MTKTFFLHNTLMSYRYIHPNKTHEFDYLSPYRLYYASKGGGGNRFQFQIKGIPVVPQKYPKAWKTQIQFIKPNVKIIYKPTHTYVCRGFLNRGLESVSTNGSKQTETMLTFWPAFEIKYSFVIYFVVAGVVRLTLSVFYFNILKGFCIGFFFSSFSSIEIAWLCESGCDSLSRWVIIEYRECQAVYNFPL